MAVCMSTYIPTAAAALQRNGDTLTFPFPMRVEPITVYCRFFDRGNTGNGQARLWGIGSLSGGVNGALYVTFNTIWGTRFLPRGVAFSSVANIAPNAGDVVEILVTLNSSGQTQLTQVLNGGVPFVATASTAVPLNQNWLTPTFFVGGALTTADYTHLFVLTGVQSLATMQKRAGVI
jgi:hypothetical protein